MGPDEPTLVQLFYARARQLAGSEEKLARLCSKLTGRSYQRQAINAWITGRNDAPGLVTLALIRHYRAELDDLLMPEADQRTLHDQLRQLREREAIIVSHVNRLLQSRGERPIDFGQEATGA